MMQIGVNFDINEKNPDFPQFFPIFPDFSIFPDFQFLPHFLPIFMTWK